MDEGPHEVIKTTKKGVSKKHEKWRAVLQLHSVTPVPAPLQACHESRTILQGPRGYQKIERDPGCQIFNKTGKKAISEIFNATSEDNGEEEWRGGFKLERRHVWVNFDLDIIDIGNGRHFGTYSPIGRANSQKVKRLKFIRDDWCFVEDEYPFGKQYQTLEEVYVDCPKGNPAEWKEKVVELGWVCGPENVHLIPNPKWAQQEVERARYRAATLASMRERKAMKA
ncbi:hypothetical protein B0T20DRAFT_360057 [Sordaria brevicollis]|uniref:Uncharacterized protein n=1 Tax=Sordaria brevicollis TaxID=83679 RepID=A0AAE0P9I6_SORBR|nr:hypothetical protein B0T20DRAFT_360057 [Sordaria brevicollis]